MAGILARKVGVGGIAETAAEKTPRGAVEKARSATSPHAPKVTSCQKGSGWEQECCLPPEGEELWGFLSYRRYKSKNALKRERKRGSRSIPLGVTHWV